MLSGNGLHSFQHFQTADSSSPPLQSGSCVGTIEDPLKSVPTCLSAMDQQGMSGYYYDDYMDLNPHPDAAGNCIVQQDNSNTAAAPPKSSDLRQRRMSVQTTSTTAAVVVVDASFNGPSGSTARSPSASPGIYGSMEPLSSTSESPALPTKSNKRPQVQQRKHHGSSSGSIHSDASPSGDLSALPSMIASSASAGNLSTHSVVASLDATTTPYGNQNKLDSSVQLREEHGIDEDWDPTNVSLRSADSRKPVTMLKGRKKSEVAAALRLRQQQQQQENLAALENSHGRPPEELRRLSLNQDHLLHPPFSQQQQNWRGGAGNGANEFQQFQKGLPNPLSPSSSHPETPSRQMQRSRPSQVKLLINRFNDAPDPNFCKQSGEAMPGSLPNVAQRPPKQKRIAQQLQQSSSSTGTSSSPASPSNPPLQAPSQKKKNTSSCFCSSSKSVDDVVEKGPRAKK